MSSSAASIIYLGMDVHKDSIAIAVLPITAKNPTRLDHLTSEASRSRRPTDSCPVNTTRCSRRSAAAR